MLVTWSSTSFPVLMKKSLVNTGARLGLLYCRKYYPGIGNAEDHSNFILKIEGM
jgi:hypothetical protein